MKRSNVYFNGLVMAALVTAILAFLPASVQAGATVKGLGTAEFDPGEDVVGTTDFAVDAHVSDILLETNQCDMDLDNLGVGNYTVTDGEFMEAEGYFLCIIPGVIEILGRVTQGRRNEDGTVTLCGTETVNDLFLGEIFENEPWAGTFRKKRKGGFVYYDVVTQPPGDAETVIDGKIKIKKHANHP